MDLTHIEFRCDNGHDIDMDIPFIEESLIVPCPICGTRYIVNNKGNHQRWKHRLIQFPALHY